jgi:SsrA-binding protein
MNRRAKHDFFIHDRFEAGLALQGSEVKSIRAGKANLQEAHIRFQNTSAWLYGCHVSPYLQANRNNHDPVRPRQLLLKKPELNKIRRGLAEKGMTVVPLRLYLKGQYIKVEIALVKGKKLHDKRATLKQKEAKKEMARRR